MSLLWPREKQHFASNVQIEETRQFGSDESLMAALKERDQEALSELFRRHSRLVFGMGYRILQDSGEAEEIVQDVFLYLYQRANQFDQTKGTAKTWIAQVTHSRSLDRKNFLLRRHFYVGTDVTELADTLAGTDDLERHIVSKWNLSQLQIALSELPERQRRTLELFFFEGLELKEIAIKLNESPENVRHHYYRGLQKLRKNGLVQALKDTDKE